MFLQSQFAKTFVTVTAAVTILINIPANAKESEPDRLGRAVTASVSNDPCIVYTYDANGNRLSQTITVSGGGMSPTWGTGVWGCFTWTP